MSCSDLSSVLANVNGEGSATVSIELGTRKVLLRILRPVSPTALASLDVIPPHDADVQADTVVIRDRIRSVLRTTSSPPLFLIQILAAVHGYVGPTIATVAAGLRVLHQIPRSDEVDWSAIICIPDPVSDSTRGSSSVAISDSYASPPPPTNAAANTTDAATTNGCSSVAAQNVDAFGQNSSPPATAPDRIGKLEHDMANLSLTLSQLSAAVQAVLPRLAPAALQPAPQTLPNTVPPTSVQLDVKGKGRARPQTPPVLNVSSSSASSSAPMDEGPPVWEHKSSAPALTVLGSIYEHLLRTGAHTQAAELFAVLPTIDYQFLPAKEASDSDSGDNVYVSKNSGNKWRKDYPPPHLCFACGLRHWREKCPVAKDKQEHSASTSFPRGKPPGRYYVAKNGKVFDTQRRPTTDCSKCNKAHWWFACPRANETLHVPKGASFTDTRPQRVDNQNAARYKHRSDDDQTSDEYSSDAHSEFDERLPQKTLQVCPQSLSPL